MIRGLTAALMVVLLSRGGGAQASGKLPPAVTPDSASAAIEEVVQIPLEVEASSASQLVLLEGTVFRPIGAGPFPLVVLNHGAIGGPDRSPRWRPVEQARWFVDRGLVVVVPMRRGNANSQGEWAEGFGACDQADYIAAAFESAKDILATIDFMTSLPYVQRGKTVLVGHSAGGLAALAAAASRPAAVAAVLSFAGGRGSQSDDDGLTRRNCSPAALVDAAARLGRRLAVPTFWLYSENDRYFPPPLAHEMFAAFQRASGQGTFVPLPAFESDGHAIFWKPAAMDLWTGEVGRILDRLRPAPRR